ncbi:hypothetical protein BC629DRAFT_158960 [Irpex lacteus]|nr:hypothetical protein BC629DRAFT_158960 [Irpex lacteus]
MGKVRADGIVIPPRDRLDSAHLLAPILLGSAYSQRGLSSLCNYCSENAGRVGQERCAVVVGAGRSHVRDAQWCRDGMPMPLPRVVEEATRRRCERMFRAQGRNSICVASQRDAIVRGQGPRIIAKGARSCHRACMWLATEKRFVSQSISIPGI